MQSRLTPEYRSLTLNLGGVGQALSLLIKCGGLVHVLSLYDIVNAPGVATDLTHINTECTVSGYLPKDDGLIEALKNGDIVILTAGGADQKVGYRITFSKTDRISLA